MSNRRTAAGQYALEEQRRRLVAAASDAILERGLSGVTLAHIASAAGISTGSVNFYFTSKEELLLETLKSVTGEFYRAVHEAVAGAGPSDGDRLRALVLAATDPAILQPGSAAVWYGFMSESKSRREYQTVCADHDDQFHFLVVDLCRRVMDGAETPLPHDAEVVALAISGMIDMAWQGVLFDAERFDFRRARMQCLALLATLFPWVFVPDDSGPARRLFGRPDIVVAVRQAGEQDVAALAELLHRHRLAVGASSQPAETLEWIRARLGEADLRILLAEEPDGRLRGFAWTLSAHCPVSLAPYRVLQSLFVDGDLRRGGVGQALLGHIQALCAERGEVRLEIETPVRDAVARALYRSAGARELPESSRLSIRIPGDV